MEQLAGMETATRTWQGLNQSENTNVKLIQKSDMEAIVEMMVEGRPTYLGEVRHFKSNTFLKENMPQELSIAWTKMPSGKELPTHFHPCASLIIVTQGTGRSTGDTEVELKAGDVVFIPPWNLHGFKGTGDEGFTALSIQFQESGIFSSEENPETTYFDRESIPLEERQLKIFSREDLESIHKVVVAGEEKNLGTLKNFSSSQFLKDTLPVYFSCSWVHLSKTEVLEDHVHATDSMIIVAEGEGSVSGDLNCSFKEGEIVYVPAGNDHGFQGRGESGFWALSIQFEEVGLYEDKNDPLVRFIQRQTDRISYKNFIALNERFGQEFQKNPIFQISPEELNNNPTKKAKLLDCLQVMSNSFQRLMYSRVALCSDPSYKAVFLDHFMEELGHDDDLRKERESQKTMWEPALEATTFWFFGKNFLLDDPGRIVMIQMCLEKGASIFYGHFAKILTESMSSEHIEKHCDADEGHDSMGVELLSRESEFKLADLTELMEQSWSMLNEFAKITGKLIKKA